MLLWRGGGPSRNIGAMTAAYLFSAQFADDLSNSPSIEDRAWPTVDDVTRVVANEDSRWNDADAVLLRRMREGDESAYRELVFSHFVPLVRFALTLGLARADAEDVVQEVLSGVWTNRARWSPVGSVRAYLFAAARHRVVDVLRHAGVERRNQEAARDALHGRDDVDEDGADEERRAMLQRLIPQLTERQQMALALRYEHEMTHAEIAQALGISLRAAEQLVKRALLTLRSWLR